MNANDSTLRPQPSALSPQPPSERRRALALFLAFLGFYLLTASGHFYATDEETVFRVTESIVERRTLALPEGAWGLAATVGRDGRRYAVYGPGQSFLAVPLYVAGKVAAPLLPDRARGYAVRFAAGLLNPIVTAATVALLYRLARRLGYGGGAALGLAASYGLATTAWPHGRTFFAEPLTALLLLLSFYGLVRAGGGGQKADERADENEPSRPPVASPSAATQRVPGPPPSALILSGMAAVAALAVKPQAAIVLPVLGLYLLWVSAAPQIVAGRLRVAGGRAVRRACWWGVGLGVAALPFALYNAWVYGGPFQTGYGGSASADLFTTPFLTGLYGLTLSSGKGLLWYAPPVILAVAGWWAFGRRQGAAAALCLGVVAAHLAFYSRVSYWHGDGSWGPRYLTIALPFAVLPLVALLDGLRARPFRLVLVGAVVVAGVAVQLLGVLVNFDWYLQRSEERARHFTPAASPILAHARTLGARAEEWRARAFPPPGTALLRDGFSYAEGAGDALFPRWTTGTARVALHPAGPEPLTIKLTFFDHRPPALRARPTILVNGVPLADRAIEWRDLGGTGEGWVAQFVVPATAGADGAVALALQIPAWNPKAAGQGDRDEELGVFVHNLEAWQAGQSLTVREGLAIGTLPDTPRQAFWWFNDDAIRHHPVDHWAWYVAAAGFGGARAALWAGGYAALALAILVTGLTLGWRAAPAGAWRLATPMRRARRGSGRRGAAKGRARPRPAAGSR